MEAIILAAGKGNRLKAVTEGRPKCYIPLAGETLLERNLRLLRGVGIERTVLVTGYQRGRFQEDFAAPDIVLAFNPFFEVANVLASYWAGMHHLQDDFLYLHADTVFDPRVLEMLVDAEGELVLACDQKVCGEEEMKYRVRDGEVVEINKTMAAEESRGEFLGLCKIGRPILGPLRAAVESILERGEFGAFFEVAIQELIDQKAAKATVLDVGDLPWMEIDFPEDYEGAKKLFAP